MHIAVNGGSVASHKLSITALHTCGTTAATCTGSARTSQNERADRHKYNEIAEDLTVMR